MVGKQRSRRDGLSKKTQRIVHTDGSVEPYTFWQASREGPAEHLPAGMSRKRVTGSGPSKSEAEKRLDENFEDFLRGEAGRGATRLTGKMTVRRLFEEWDRNNSAGAVSHVQARANRGMFNNHVLPALGEKRLDALTETDLTFFIHQTLVAKTDDDGSPLLGPSARRNVYMALSGALSFAVRNRYLPANPLKAVRSPKKTKPNEDIDAFIPDAQKVRETVLAGGHPDECRWALTLLGLRRSERLGLRWRNVLGLDTDSPSLVVADQLARETGKGLHIKPTTKGGKPRTIRLVEPWVSVLRRYRDQWETAHGVVNRLEPTGEFSDLLFLRADGKPISQNDDNDDWHALLEAVGVPYWRGHLMRHYTAMMLAAQPALSVNDLTSLLGHESEALSLYYAHANQGRQSAALVGFGEAMTPENQRQAASDS